MVKISACMPLKQFIVSLENKMLNKYLGETQAPWPLELSGGLPLSSFLHSKLGK